MSDSGDRLGKGPSRGYSWPPFEAGNLAHRTHGTRSERLVAERAEQLRCQLLESYEYLGDPIFAEALARYVRANARAMMLHEYLVEKAEAEGVQAVPRSLWDSATRADAHAARCASDCGLDARGHSAIARDLGYAKQLGQLAGAAKVAELAERGRALREASG